eukprot:CAMPEP_0204324256 /NCGR_PEP_ID=MMETSP0469-20131031/10081_1 /ASSEMBLY_ACC=CAM_ASM_000384 /TAXON_ID=2969 /ORGANISM="Oxyrrhis marina" /LENGTH=69 /DNA_ID=CAMNT_0051305877 /DNA_START=62 /DNA_END=268 /DNA_ORIENTATION=-
MALASFCFHLAVRTTVLGTVVAAGAIGGLLLVVFGSDATKSQVSAAKCVLPAAVQLGALMLASVLVRGL